MVVCSAFRIASAPPPANLAVRFGFRIKLIVHPVLYCLLKATADAAIICGVI
jgi:hypothetical protein